MFKSIFQKRTSKNVRYYRCLFQVVVGRAQVSSTLTPPPRPHLSLGSLEHSLNQEIGFACLFWLLTDKKPPEMQRASRQPGQCPERLAWAPPPGNWASCDQRHHERFLCRKWVDLEFGKLAVPSALPAPLGKSLVHAPRGEMVPLIWAKLLLKLRQRPVPRPICPCPSDADTPRKPAAHLPRTLRAEPKSVLFA